MGCITSKVVTRSGSFKEELKHSLRRPDSKGFHSSGRRDHHQQFLALVYNTNSSLPTILQSATNYSHDDDVQQHNSSTTDHLGTKKDATTNATLEELLAGLDLETATSANIVDAPKRSKSSDWSRDPSKLSVQLGIGSINVSNDDDKELKCGIERCRSFHTVEEYEKLVIKANSSCTQTCFDEYEHGLEMRSKREFSAPPEPQLVTTSTTSSCDSAVTDFGEDTISRSRRRADEVVLNEKGGAGSRRKAMAKELASLKIPSTMELPTIASLKDWVVQVEEQVVPANASDPPEVCVADTPKFGVFDLLQNMNTSSNNSKCNGDVGCVDSNSVFDPDMLSAIEEAMQQLETEEERVLKLIDTKTQI